MRVGFNPNRDKSLNLNNYNHQVIIPVHIPCQEGYFKDSFDILTYCLESLFSTSHSGTYFTIVNNGSCPEVVDYLNDLFSSGKVHELIHSDAIGKLNSIIKGLVGQNFDLITISDSDVMFLNGWQEAVYNVYQTFPKAGAVCTTPSSRSLRTHTANIYWDFFFSGRLRFSKVSNPMALQYFAKSIGNVDFYNNNHLKQYLTVENSGQKAVVGAGHFVCTYRKEIFRNFRKTYSSYSMGGNSEGEFLDIPVVSAGLWRLSTIDNYTYHMGNVAEPWMKEELKKLNGNVSMTFFRLHAFKGISRSENFVKNRLFAKIILKKSILAFYLKTKSPSQDFLKNYLI